MRVVIHITMFLAGAMVLITNYSSVDAFPTFNSDAMRETDSLQHPVVMKAKSTISNTRTPLFNRRQLALRDRIMSRLLTTAAPIRIRSKIYPTLRTANPNRVYVDSLSRDRNNMGHSVLVRPRITKPTEIPAFLTAKFPIMSRNPNIEKYQFNRIRTATPLGVIFRHSDEDDKYSMEDLALVISKENKSAVVEKLRLEITSGVQSTTAIPSNIFLKFSNEQQDGDSLENLPIGISYAYAWEPMKDGVSMAVLSKLDASIDNSPELPGEISTESDEDLYPVSRRTLNLPLEQPTTVSQVQSTTATPWKASIGRFSDEQQDDVSLERIGQHVARGISWESIKEQMLIMPEAEKMEDATEMVPRTEMPTDFSIDDYTTTY